MTQVWKYRHVLLEKPLDLYHVPSTVMIYSIITVALSFLLLFPASPFDVFSGRANASPIPMDRVGLLWWELEEDMDTDEISSHWKDIRRARLKRLFARGETKSPVLRWGDIPFKETVKHHRENLTREIIREKAEIWIRNADGRISQAAFDPAVKDNLTVDIPEDLELNGLYLLGIHLDTGETDIDPDGATERVYLSAKRLLYHRKRGGHQGNERDSFFDEPHRFPLEIGFSDARLRRDYQRAYREYGMKVVYGGKPLADTEVHVISGSGWRKTVHTDSAGEFLMTPFGNMEKGVREKYLYVACHHDPAKREYHCATLTMKISTYPEWLSRSHGFVLWAVLGTGLSVLIIIMGIWLKKKHTREAILKFENQRIKKG